jgi:phosphinothricin acetyltransferase
VFIQKFEQSDYPVVKDIYQQGIDTGNATFQLNAKTWDEWNNAMHSHSRIVAVENNTILGRTA